MLSIQNHALNVKRVAKGFSLLETLIALSLGSFILFLASNLYSDLYLSQNRQRELFQLQKNAHQIIHYLQQHILHSGYQGKNREESNFGWFKYQGNTLHLEKNCLVMIQDSNGDGCLGKRAKQCINQGINLSKEINKEIIGIKLENQQLWIIGKQNKFTPCYEKECSQWLKSCQNIQWEKIATLSDNRIEQLDFQWEKPNSLVKIDLKLSSLKDPKITYSLKSYAYIFN